MDRGYIIRKIGVSACGFELTEENFIKLKKSGLSAMELCREPVWVMLRKKLQNL